MRIYIATRFTNKSGFDAMRALLLEKGHRITHDWTTEDAEKVQADRKRAYLEDCAFADWDGVEKADAMILLAHENMQGALVELGMALAANIHVIVVGANEPSIPPCIFYYLPQIKHVPTLESAVEAIEALIPNDNLGGLGAIFKALANESRTEQPQTPNQ